MKGEVHLVRMTQGDFLLSGDAARRLYEKGRAVPHIVFGTGFSAEEIDENRHFENITEAWLGSHSAWEGALRASGTAEVFLTGEGSDYEKFRSLCSAMPRLLGHPAYLLAHLELRRLFGCELPLNEANCDTVWALTAEKLQTLGGVRDCLALSGVDAVLKREGPCASLVHYGEREGLLLLPAFDVSEVSVLARRGYRGAVESLSFSTGIPVVDCASLCRALSSALDKFCAVGCRVAYHTISAYVPFASPNEYHASLAFKRALETDGRDVDVGEAALFERQMLRVLGREYVKRGMVLHLRVRGGDTAAVRALLIYLNSAGALPRTLLYPESPALDAGELSSLFPLAEGEAPRVAVALFSPFDARERIMALSTAVGVGSIVGTFAGEHRFLSFPEGDLLCRQLCSLVAEWEENSTFIGEGGESDRLISRVLSDNLKARCGL